MELDGLLSALEERANTARTIFMLLDSDADGLVAVEQARSATREGETVSHQSRCLLSAHGCQGPGLRRGMVRACPPAGGLAAHAPLACGPRAHGH